MAKERPFTVAAAQIAPVFMDRKATVDKACEAIAEAAKNGAKIVVFPEALVPGYPDWVWVTPPGVRGDILAEMYGRAARPGGDDSEPGDGRSSAARRRRRASTSLSASMSVSEPAAAACTTR